MRKRFLFLLVLLLSACTAVPQVAPAAPTADRAATLSAIVSATMSAISTETPAATATPDPTATPTIVTSNEDAATEQSLTRMDEQGAVIVDVTPSNLSSRGESIDFEVGMNTHSVDLSMDLAALSILKTDTGLMVTPLFWKGMSGGHHVSGKLVFPAQVEGKPLLSGATTITLVISNVDAPERTFIWEIGS